MFNTPLRAATSTCSRKHPQIPQQITGITTAGAIGLSIETFSTNSNRARPPSLLDPNSSDGIIKD
jgi:hypothetical protein